MLLNANETTKNVNFAAKHVKCNMVVYLDHMI